MTYSVGVLWAGGADVLACVAMLDCDLLIAERGYFLVGRELSHAAVPDWSLAARFASFSLFCFRMKDS